MNIALGSDHAGFALKEVVKEFLKSFPGITVKDFGTFSLHPVDYPDVALEVARSVAGGKQERGILICGTGIGMSITANKVPGIRAARCEEPVSAHLARAHNDANIVTLGGRILGSELAKAIVKTFLESKFEGGRHLRRVEKIEALEESRRKLPK